MTQSENQSGPDAEDDVHGGVDDVRFIISPQTLELPAVSGECCCESWPALSDALAPPSSDVPPVLPYLPCRHSGLTATPHYRPAVLDTGHPESTGIRVPV